MAQNNANQETQAASIDRFLIWGLAFREPALPLARFWLESLLQIGKWKHDILLLGDEIVADLSVPGLRTVNVVESIERRYNFPRRQWTHLAFNNFKSQVLYFTDVSAYDYILYLDIDILVNSDRLEDLIRSKWRKGLIAVQRDCIPLPKRRFRALAKLGMPDIAERVRWARQPICAGMMGFPTNCVGLSALRDYHDACIQMRFSWSDQAKLAALLYRKYQGAWEFLGDTAFGSRIAPPYRETLVHFTGPRKVLIENYFRSQFSRMGGKEEMRGT